MRFHDAHEPFFLNFPFLFFLLDLIFCPYASLRGRSYEGGFRKAAMYLDQISFSFSIMFSHPSNACHAKCNT